MPTSSFWHKSDDRRREIGNCLRTVLTAERGFVEAKKQRRNLVATVIVDQLGGALEQVTQDQFGSLASAGKLARKLFSTLSDVHPPRKYLIVEGV